MKGFFLLILIVFNLNYSNAQQRGNKRTYPVFWRITYNNAVSPSYLLGSMHPIKADSFFYRFKTLLELLGSSRLFVCESLGFSDSLEAKKYTEAFDKLPKKSFRQWFGKDSALVDDFFVKKFQFKDRPSTIINSAKNSLAQVSDIQALTTMVWDTLMVLSGLHRFPNPNFDDAIRIAVQNEGGNIMQLDDPGFVSKNILINSAYAKEVVGYIKTSKNIINKKGIKNDKYYDMAGNMKEYYQKATLTTNLDWKPNKHNAERNQSWIRKLIPELKKGNIFIVVGFGHLFVDYGLIPELRKKGFKITPVYLKPAN